MVPWSSVHRTLALGLVGAVAAATVLVGPADPDDPSDTTPVSVEGEDSTLQEQSVPLVDDPDADAAEPAPETLEDAPEEAQEEAKPQDEGEDSGQGGGDPDAPVAELERTTTDPFNMVGVTWEGGADLRVEVSHRSAGTWSAFEDLEVEAVDPTEGGRAGTEPLWINDGADGVSVRITSTSGELPRDVKVATIDPGEDGLIAPTSGAAGQPPIITRSSWGAKSASCSSSNPATRGATIHHTAGSNTYSQAQVAGILRSYQDYHRSRGWCDIGYNFLVDRFGRIYEGRVGGITNMVRGAHAGTNGANTYTVGVAMMGTFTNVQPTLATRAAVADLVAWRFRLAGLPARGTHTLDGRSHQRIIGHRDVKATECPGRLGYAWVTTGLRSSVAERLASGPSGGAPAFRWAAPTNLTVTGSDATSMSLSWNQVETAKKYVVQVSENASMSKPMHFAFSTNSGRVTGLKPSTRYHVRIVVRHSLTNEALSPWSPAISDSTFRWAAPGNPRVTGADGTSLSLAWNRVETAKKYVVQVSENASMSKPRYFAFSTNSGRVTGLDPSTRYHVRVVVRHSVTNQALSPWTDVISRTTTSEVPPPPTYRWPAPASFRVTGSDATSMSLAWNRVETAKKYVVQVSENASMSKPRYFAFSTNSGRVTGLDPSTRYHVRVVVRHSVTNEALSPWTSTVTGSTTATPPAGPTYRWPAPANFRVTGSDATSMSLAWNRVETAKKYVVQVSRSASMASPKHFAFTTNSGRVTGLDPSTTYHVRVIVRHSVSNAALSPWTDVESASTKAAAGGSGVNDRTIGSATSIAFKGRGFGHGIGMSQYGAYGGSQSGAMASTILGRYYPGTALADSSRYIRVLVTADDDGSLAVLAASNLRFLQGSRSISLPTSVNGAPVSHWRIEPLASDRRQSTLRYKSGSTWRTYQNMTWSGAADFAAPTMRLAMPGGGTVTYRYKLRAAQASSSSTTRQTVNVVHLNDYTRGVVAREVPSSWPEQALRAQSIAARTYGLRSISSGGWYDICDTTSCQVYGGASAETARTNAAVASTANRVLTYQGSPAFTQFSSSSGGFTNQGSQPYLRPVNDPWDGTSANPNRSWTQNVSVSTIRARYPSIGTPQRLRVTKRNGHGADGGRVSSLQIIGSAGSVTVTGPAARSAFGLKSDWFGF